MIEERFLAHFTRLSVDQVESYLQVAIEVGASAIHLDPGEGYLRVRFRLDNQLQDVTRLKHVHDERYPHQLIGQVKARAGMNLISKLPETGRFQLKLADTLHSFRCSTLPGVFGERMVVRIFDLSRLTSLGMLGFRETNLKRLLGLVDRESGLVLVAGTSGSGRTTLLYSLLTHLHRASRSVNTLEDPVECHLEGVNQTQLVADGMDYATALRGMLRMDPDVVMVGEVADGPTAELVCRAALTGRLVITSVQATDTATALLRMVELGVSLPTLSQAVNGVVAQTLLRRLCPSCARIRRVPPLEKVPTYEAAGCPECRFTGYQGHHAVHEVMEFDPPTRMRLSASIHEDDLRYLNLVQGMETMKEDAVLKAAAGRVALREALAVSEERLDRISQNIDRAMRSLQGLPDEVPVALEAEDPPEVNTRRPAGLLRPMASLRAGAYMATATEKAQPAGAE